MTYAMNPSPNLKNSILMKKHFTMPEKLLQLAYIWLQDMGISS